MKKVTIILMVVALATVSQAATLSWSTIAPTVDETDIANFTGVSMDQRNIADGDDEGTYIAGGRQGQGQTFTTGSNAGGYALKAITMQHVTYTTWWSIDTGWTTYNGGRWMIEIGTISNGVFTPIATEEAYMDDSAPANGAGVDGTGQFFTLVLDSPVGLVANTEYAFSIDTTADFNLWDAPYCETNGDGRTSTNYSGGEAFSMEGGTGTVTPRTGDRVFHLDIESPEYVIFTDPANGDTEVAVDLSDRDIADNISWVAPSDPNIVSIQSYDIYVDPNQAKVESRDNGCEIAATGITATQYDPPDLSYDTTYYMIIDTHYTHDELGPGQVGESDTISFTTMGAVPVIQTYNSVVVTEAMLPASLSAIVTDGDGDLSTATFTVLEDDINYPDGAVYTLTDTTTDLFAPSCTFTSDTPGYYKVRLVMEDAAGNVAIDRAEVALYADDDINACAAAQFAPSWDGFSTMDFDQDCDVDLMDFVEYALQWLDDRSLQEPENYDWYIPYSNTNYGIENGDFESGDFTALWYADATITTLDPLQGYYSAEWTVDADGSGIVAWAGPVAASTSYELQATILGGSNNTGDEFLVRYDDNDTNVTNQTPSWTPDGITPQTATITFTTTADDEGRWLEFVIYGNTEGVYYKVDDLRFIELP